VSGAPLSWDAGTLDGTAWQGIRFLSIELPAGGDYKAIVTVHLNRPAKGITASDILVTGGRHIPPPAHDVLVGEAGVAPETAVVRFRGFGDHSLYAVTLRDGGDEPLHPFFASAEFRFSIDCESGDCRDVVGLPQRPAGQPPAVDLLTKDFNGFVRVLSDWVKVKNPRMTDLSPAGFERMLLDLLAWAGDMHSYFQDRVANEAFIETARQRFSLRQHSILLGSEIDDGRAATTVLAFDVGASGFVPAGLQVRMRTSADEQPVTFTVAQRTRVRDASSSTALRVAAFPGATDAELPAGSTSMLLWGHGAELAAGDRLAIVQGSFSQIVTVTHARRTAAAGWVADPDDAFAPGDPESEVTEVHWREPLTRAVRPWGPERFALHANLVDAVYGAPRTATGGAGTRGGEIPIVLTRRSSVVTRGPGGGLQLRALRVPEWPVIHDDGGPAVAVLVSGTEWTAVEHLHASHSFDLHYTAAADEDGAVWLGFGDGVEGRSVPLADDGTAAAELEIRYRIGDPAAGNVGLGTLVEIARPPTGSDEQVALDALAGVRVTNVVTASGGRAPATLAREKEELPQSLRHGPLQRAVTLPDYADVAMQLPGVGRAVARSADGPFNTVMVLVDPEDAEELGEELRAQLHAHVDALRMTGREHVVLPAEYVPLHVELEVCADPGFAKHLVRDRVLSELRPGTRERPGFFHPDRLSFGDTVRLGDVLALVQGVAGVRSARAAIFRPLQDRGDPQVRDVIRLGGTRVARLDADADFPEDGILVVRVVGLDNEAARTSGAPAEWRVSAVATREHGAARHRIVAVGGTHPDGTAWRLTVPEAIREVERGRRMYVERPVGDAVDVVVSRTGAGRRYLRTVADGDEPNNLLALPPLPDE
jgi:hypothetical protein